MLYLVPTPIGNLGDMTFRAVETLQSVDLILAEDTRTSGKLLKHYDIETPMRAYHAHNEHRVTDDLIKELTQGARFALITDAGSPGISDPGFLMVRACHAAGVQVVALPGATAFVPALTASGLPSDSFYFEGFLPQKKGRQTRLKAIAQLDKTVILYESPHRLVKCLLQLQEHCGSERRACVCRELSKLHEEVKQDSLANLIEYYESHPPKGEIVIILAAELK